jgi:hypothetical protein
MHAASTKSACIATVKRELKKRQDRVYEKVVAGKRAVGADLSRPPPIYRPPLVDCLQTFHTPDKT